MKTTPRNAHISKMVPLDFQGKPFVIGPRIQMIDHPQTMKFAGSLVQFVGTPEVFMKTLGEVFHAETREKNNKTSKDCCLGVNCCVFFSTKLLGDMFHIPSSPLSTFCCLREFLAKSEHFHQRNMEISPSAEDLAHCCFHPL